MLLDEPLERRATERVATEPTAQRVEHHVADEDAHRAGEGRPPETDDALGREQAGGEARGILGHEGAEDDDEDQDPETRAVGHHEVRIRLGRRDGSRATGRLAGLGGGDEFRDLRSGGIGDLLAMAAREFEQAGLGHQLGGVAGGVDRRDPVGLAVDEQRGAVPSPQHRLGVGQVAVEEHAGVTAVIRQAIGQPEVGRGDVEQHEGDMVEEVDELVGDGVAEERVFLGAGRGDERQRSDASRMQVGQRQRDRPTHALADEVETSFPETGLQRQEQVGGEGVVAHRSARAMVGGRPAHGIDRAEAGGLAVKEGPAPVLLPAVRQARQHDDRERAGRAGRADLGDLDGLGQFRLRQAVRRGDPTGHQDQQDVSGQHDPLHRDAPEVALAIGEGGHPSLIKGRPPQGARREGQSGRRLPHLWLP